MMHTIPAAEGYYALFAFSEDNASGSFIQKYPIIGWRVDIEEGETDPLLPGFAAWHNRDCENLLTEAILLPDGRVMDSCGDLFDSEQAWEEDSVSYVLNLRRRHAEKKEGS